LKAWRVTVSFASFIIAGSDAGVEKRLARLTAQIEDLSTGSADARTE
jgi:hypothetical protein